MRRIALLLLIAAACCGTDDAAAPASASAASSSSSGPGGSCPISAPADPPVDEPVLHTARWAFEPWISKDISDTDDTYAFVDGFRSRDIPVGVVVLDSPWETNYNTFVPNPKRYHDFGKLVTPSTSRTPATCTRGSAGGYDDALARGFFVDQGASYNWWKGAGGSIDFENPAAVTWWHRRQDPLYDLGFDGFKLDFGDSYVSSDLVLTSKGPIAHQEYSEAYYRDFYAYGQKKRGKDFVTMVRAWDESYGFKGRFYAKKEDAPVTWMATTGATTSGSPTRSTRCCDPRPRATPSSAPTSAATSIATTST